MLNGPVALTIEWALAGLALVFVLLRLYFSFLRSEKAQNHFGDYCVVMAWLAFTSCCASDIQFYLYGMTGQPVTFDAELLKLNNDPAKTKRMLELIYGSALPYVVDIWLIKTSILAFYFTIIPKDLPKYRFALMLLVVVVFATFFISIILNIAWCMPIGRNWSLDPHQVCVASASVPVFLTTVGCNITTDVLMFCFPLPLLRTLHVPRNQKFGIIFIFSLGFANISASFARVITVAMSATQPQVSIWTAIECSTGLIIACSPALRSLVLRRKRENDTKSVWIRESNGNSGSGGVEIVKLDPYRSLQHVDGCASCGIWDGTDKTAPEWVKIGALLSQNTPQTAFDLQRNTGPSESAFYPNFFTPSPGEILNDDSKAENPCSYDARGVSPPRIGVRPGRGIIEHISDDPLGEASRLAGLVASSSVLPAPPLKPFDEADFSFLPDPPYLSRPEEYLPDTIPLDRWETGDSRIENVEIMQLRAAPPQRKRSNVKDNSSDELIFE